jgi:hypothetical protein
VVWVLLWNKKKQKKLLVSDKFERVKKLNDAIAGLQNYCDVRISQELGTDFGSSLDGLPKDTLDSPLKHLQNLRQLSRYAGIFLSRESRAGMEELIQQVQRAVRAELRRATGDRENENLRDAYQRLSVRPETS